MRHRKHDCEQGVEGYLDHVLGERIRGWAWLPSEPSAIADLEIFVDEVRVATVRADQYRDDLERAGKGDGRHAFEVPLPSMAKDGALHWIRARCGAHELLGSPRTLRSVLASAPAHTEHRSRFGGLWTDRRDAQERLAAKRVNAVLSEQDAALIARFIADGFVILPQAVPEETIDDLERDVERIWSSSGPERPWVEAWEKDGHRVELVTPAHKHQRAKLLDLYAHSDAARRIAFAPAIRHFLELVFEQSIVAFQSLYFRWGSRQDLHRDTAFVKVSSPLEFAASWVALEDVQPNSGELEYYVGSHELPDYLFEGGKLWMPDHSPEYSAFIDWLQSACETAGFLRKRFRPRKGDALIWSANLAHGGSREARHDLTRKSIVTHYCPATADPVYGNASAASERQVIDAGASYTFWKREAR